MRIFFSISLGDHCFVDYVIVREDDRRVAALLPDHAIEQFVTEEPTLRHLPFSAMYQHEIRMLDARFPYPELTLHRLGIPPWEVLYVKTRDAIRYVELADELDYSQFLD